MVEIVLLPLEIGNSSFSRRYAIANFSHIILCLLKVEVSVRSLYKNINSVRSDMPLQIINCLLQNRYGTCK